MFNSVKLIRELCKARGIPVAKLEKDCGFANGYLNPKKMSRIPYDRAVTISEYLDVATDYLLTGKQNSTLTVSGKGAGQQVMELSSAEQELIRKFRRLDDRGKSAVLNALEHEYAALPGNTASTAPKQA